MAVSSPPLAPAQCGWLLATGVGAFLPLVPQVPAWLAALTTLIFAWRALLAWRRLPLPPRWLLVAVTLAGCAGVFIHYRTLLGQQAGVALLLVFLALKQLEARAQRDGLTIVLLTYFLTLTQFFENQTIPVAATTAGTALLATAALAVLADARERPVALLRRAALMLAQALPFMLILFVLFPRVSGPLWGLPADAYSSLTGLTDSMAPGAISSLSQSDAIAFRAQFDGAAPDRRLMYWRGPVLTRLEGRTWRPGEQIFARTLPYRADESAPGHVYTITLEPHNRLWLFALELPESLPPEALQTVDFQLLAKKPVRERLRYSVRSRSATDFLPPNHRMLAAALALPAGANPRSVNLGAGWTALDPATRVQRAIEFMRAQRLTYTLQPPLMSEDVADDFLFTYRRGFCEHFAAAFAVLARAAGVPTRIVTGYQGGERNPVDDTWVVRQSDAHAWAEIWLDGRGWLRVDPTAASAPARIELNLAAAVPVGEPLPLLAGRSYDWLRELRYRWWAINNEWNQWVLGYDPQRQRDLLSRLGMDAPDWGKMTAALVVLCGLALLALTAALLRCNAPRDPVQRQWQRLSRRLAKQGLARYDWEGPHDYAARIAARHPAAADEIRRIADLYSALRYGGGSTTLLAALRRRICAFSP